MEEAVGDDSTNPLANNDFCNSVAAAAGGVFMYQCQKKNSFSLLQRNN